MTNGNNISQLIEEYDDIAGLIDRAELLDRFVQALRPTAGQELVVFHWDHKYTCYDCGLPAAFYAPFMYGGEQSTPRTHFCAVCAANHAAEGEPIRRIEPLD